MKMVKLVSMLMALMMLVCSLAVPAMACEDEMDFVGTAYIGHMRVVNCEDWVSLRSYASTSASRVAKVPLGADVRAYIYNDDFHYCYYNGDWGYILCDYLVKDSIDYTPAYYIDPSDDDYIGSAWVVNCEDWVSLRTYASTSADRQCKVPLGAEVEVYYYNSEFSQCYYNGYCGYILNDYLSCYSDCADNTARVVNCEDWVSLRSYASTSASRICKVPKGAYVEAYYYNSEFAECYYNGYHGYILNDYLQW